VAGASVCAAAAFGGVGAMPTIAFATNCMRPPRRPGPRGWLLCVSKRWATVRAGKIFAKTAQPRVCARADAEIFAGRPGSFCPARALAPSLRRHVCERPRTTSRARRKAGERRVASES
jgi:hypothetical protein